MLDRGIPLNQIQIEERTEVGNDDIDTAAAIVDDLRRLKIPGKEIAALHEMPPRRQTDWQQLAIEDRQSRLDVVRAILPQYANLESLQNYWYDLQSQIKEDLYPADFVELQRDALAIAATARFFIERGRQVLTADPELDAGRPNALWVESGLPPAANGRAHIWAVKVQVLPFSFNIPQVVRVANSERPDELTSGFGKSQTAERVYVRDIQFNFPDKNDALLRTVDPLTGAWQESPFKDYVARQFEVSI